MNLENLYIVILAGGAGTRLWPMSSQERPKQFQKLISKKTMLQETYERVSFVDPSHIFVSTNEEYTDLVKEQLPSVDASKIIAEPCMRDTGPCIGLAAAMIAKINPNAVMAVIYADHLVRDTEVFQQKVLAAAELADRDQTLNIIEVKAKSPNVNLGYVKVGEAVDEVNGHEVLAFEAFKEKPDLETAKAFLADGHYLWNTGYYVWRTDVILKAFETHLPQTYAELMAIQAGENLAEHYADCDKISIDYGVMEKVDPKNVRILPADFGWNDIGTWASLHEELSSSPEENVVRGDVKHLDCSGCLIYNESERPLSVMGLQNMVVVQTDEASLVCPKAESPHLKELLKK